MTFAGRFASHRIFWSRAIVVVAIAYVLMAAPPQQMGGWYGEVSELLGFMLLVSATLWRIWCLLFIAGGKDGRLAMQGPYSMVRNPLYIGNFLGVVGFGLAVEIPLLALGLGVAFVLLYPSVVAREEERLAGLFGEEYLRYCARTPRWVPAPALYVEPALVTVSPAQVRKGILDAMWFLWVFAAWELIERLHEVGLLPNYF
jgi:protein-S-isoprenylcysteine O-methyltransferase Ste14